MSTLARQNIEVFARFLYEMEGCPEGRAREHWLRAEKQLNENLFQVDRSAPAVVKVKFGQNKFAEFMELSHCGA